MTMSRRTFFGGAIALVGATVLPATEKADGFLPVIYGDGFHDDAPGLNALIARKPVRILNERVRLLKDGKVELTAATFLLRAPLDFFPGHAHGSIKDCHFEGENAGIHVHEGAEVDFG